MDAIERGAATLGALVLVLAPAAAACSANSGGAAAPATSSTASPLPTRPTRSTGSPSPTAAIPVAGEPWLAYEDSAFRIRLVRPDGTGEHALDSLTTGPEDNPDWSPDGQRLTFVGEGGDHGSNPGLWVINADGTGLKRVVECVDPCRYLDDPAWSFDGTEIMYSRMQPDTSIGGTLETVQVDTGRTSKILTAKPGDFFSGVRYAPDGKAVVLEWVRATTADYDHVEGVTITRVDLSTKPPRLTALTKPALLAETPDWSPTGDLIVYNAPPETGAASRDLYLIRPDGTGRRRLTTLTKAGGGALHPDFTNDGTAIVFMGADGTADHTGFTTVDLATGDLSPALKSGYTSGHHPRSRPTP